jgi:hypothetical protein
LIRAADSHIGSSLPRKQATDGRHLAFTIVTANSVFPSIEGAFAANDDVGKVPTIIQQSY